MLKSSLVSIANLCFLWLKQGGVTPLHRAAESGADDTIVLLALNGADVHIATEVRDTRACILLVVTLPLHDAGWKIRFRSVFRETSTDTKSLEGGCNIEFHLRNFLKST